LRHSVPAHLAADLQLVHSQSLADDAHYGMCGAYKASEQCDIHQVRVRMKKDRKETSSSEPIGIVISSGDRTEPTPRFSAYIWGPVPDAVAETTTRAA
jgi:hypothetical protein